MEYTLLTKKELADILKVNWQTLDALRRRGGFVRAIKVGASVRFRSTDVQAWLDER